MKAPVPDEVLFDGIHLTAATSEASATITVKGRSISHTDAGRVLVIRGGANFIIGTYLIVESNAESNTWRLNRPCTSGPGAGMTGRLVVQDGRWHDPVPEYYDASLPNNPGKSEARQAVLNALNVIEPRVLKSLAKRCLKHELLEPEAIDIHDWCCSVEHLQWGHLPAPITKGLADKTVYQGNLRPLRDAIVRWARDDRGRRWNLCDNTGEPLDWVAEAAVQTLVWWCWHRKGKLPKRLRWEVFGLDCYRSLDTDEAWTMFGLEQQFDAGAGYIRIAPEDGEEASRLSESAQRATKKDYRALGTKLGLTRMRSISDRHFEWYAQKTFLSCTYREIRDAEPVPLGDPEDPDAFSAYAHAVTDVAKLVGFRRA